MRRATARERQRAAKLKAKGRVPIEPKYDSDPRVAAKAIDGEAMRARGETPPWEEADGDEG